MDGLLAQSFGLCGRFCVVMASRPLTPDDKQIWSRVARTVRPLAPVQGGDMDALLRGAAPYIHLPPAPPPVLHHSARDVPVRSDKQVRKGRVSYAGKIDLHDFTRDQAFPILVRRLTRCYEKNERCALVVTGKGANLEGVLRLSLPSWLADPSIRPFVAGYAQAHIRHGGSGAFYVFLKRKPS